MPLPTKLWRPEFGPLPAALAGRIPVEAPQAADAQTTIYCTVPDVYVGTDILHSDDDLEFHVHISRDAIDVHLRDEDGNWQAVPKFAQKVDLATIERHDAIAWAAITQATKAGDF